MVRGCLGTAATLKHFYRLVVELEYPEHDEVMRLYSLDDEWEGKWGHTRAEIEAEMTGIMTTLSAGRPKVPSAVLKAIIQFRTPPT